MSRVALSGSPLLTRAAEWVRCIHLLHNDIAVHKLLPATGWRSAAHSLINAPLPDSVLNLHADRALQIASLIETASVCSCERFTGSYCHKLRGRNWCHGLCQIF